MSLKSATNKRRTAEGRAGNGKVVIQVMPNAPYENGFVRIFLGRRIDFFLH